MEARTARSARERMVEEQLARRGVRDWAVLRAMVEVPRESFVAPEMVEFAYDDTPLPIDEGQTISQPYIVALMAEVLELGPEDRVLDVGTGSGYAAAVLSRIVAEVFTVERHRSLVESARSRFEALGLDNIRVRRGDGTLGWEEHAPYDAIVVAAAGPRVPAALIEQLAPGGRLVIPVGATPRTQRLLRVRKGFDGSVVEEDLGDVRFVPLIGAEGWRPGEGPPDGEATAPAGGGREGGDPGPEPRGTERGAGSTGPRRRWPRPGLRRAPYPSAPPGPRPSRGAPELIRRSAEPFDHLDDADLDGLLERIGNARVVLLGESTHGTSEFYRMRARITRALVERRGFRIVAVEADWPDAAHVNAWIHGRPPPAGPAPFARFPTWMWANREVAGLARWLRSWNADAPARDRVGFYGLDLYSLFGSIEAVLRYLEDSDPEAAALARHRYGCLTPWQGDAATYGRAVVSGSYRACEDEVVRALSDLLERSLDAGAPDGERLLDATQNARVVANAERYYRMMYYGGRDAWNLRDQHMFDTLAAVLDHDGPDARAVVWEHNSHIGDASATEMGARGEHNVGQLCRRRFHSAAYLVGFATHRGTVAAAHHWGGVMEVMEVRPSLEGSYERLCHESGLPSFLLPLRAPGDEETRLVLLPERLERAIGVLYRPETELQSHYFRASLPRQFDELVWFDETRAVRPLEAGQGEEDASEGVPETFPFAV